MGFFDFIKGKSQAGEKKTSGSNLNRNSIKEKIVRDFKEKLNFTDLETKEILEIVELAEIELDEIKNRTLSQNKDNPNVDDEDTPEQIKKVAAKMSEDIKNKATEIIKRRKDMEDLKKADY